jgi:tripeptidyl-peptidase-1
LLKQFHPDINPNTTFNLISIDGGINNQLPSGAGFLAVNLPSPRRSHLLNSLFRLWTFKLLSGSLLVFLWHFFLLAVVSNDLYTAYLDQANYLLSLANPPQTVVNTFGTFGTTSSFKSQISSQAAECVEAFSRTTRSSIPYLGLFAMRTPNSLLGVSYIVASGDFGSGFPVGNCASFNASFPATCPL